MAQGTETAFESGRSETIDLSSGGSGAGGASHWGGYLGVAIVAAILVAMVFLQSTSASTF